MNYAFYFSVSAIHISQWFRCCTFASDESGRAQNLHEISIDLLLNSNKLSRSRFSAALNAQILNANGGKEEKWSDNGQKEPIEAHASPFIRPLRNVLVDKQTQRLYKGLA